MYVAVVKVVVWVAEESKDASDIRVVLNLDVLTAPNLLQQQGAEM